MDGVPFEIVVPAVMYGALLFWIGRRANWTRLLTAAAFALVLVLVALIIERR